MKIFTSYSDVTGTGAIQHLSTVLGFKEQLCKWWQVSFVSNASGNIGRVGDSTITSTQGIPIGGGLNGGQFAPALAENLRNYDLADIYVIIPAGDKINLSYGV
jgi:hypothetical protein